MPSVSVREFRNHTAGVIERVQLAVSGGRRPTRGFAMTWRGSQATPPMTSIRFADEAMPALVFISPVTLAELQVGVLSASGVETRTRRLETVGGAPPTAPRDARTAPDVNDLWIAATALTHDLPVVTQDADFDPIAGVSGVMVIRV